MLEVCFGSSTCGAISAGLNNKNVIFILPDMEMGRIPKKAFWSARREWYHSFYKGSKTTINNNFRKNKDRINAIIDHARRGEDIRIWTSSAPSVMCGFYFLVSLLQKYDFKLYELRMPQGVGFRDKDCDCLWGEIEPWNIKNYINLTTELTKSDIELICEKWSRLQDENAELRLNIDGVIKSVPVDYIDQEIISYAPQNNFKFYFLIGEVLYKCKHAVSDSFIAQRILVLIENGEFIVVEEANKNHSAILRRKSNA